ncbi:hypothetical protein CC80DRAFT_509148 [Byssothecium circinans]|uniref:Uncharacterized protein n=1 Tax=Byssothecium circinans TaxID=147558 RepID=A0A6A5TE19_9PLEO|nr:hypothetical protein CC80DRAFT_509148 [Byssothecium circinans]
MPITDSYPLELSYIVHRQYIARTEYIVHTHRASHPDSSYIPLSPLVTKQHPQPLPSHALSNTFKLIMGPTSTVLEPTNSQAIGTITLKARPVRSSSCPVIVSKADLSKPATSRMPPRLLRHNASSMSMLPMQPYLPQPPLSEGPTIEHDLISPIARPDGFEHFLPYERFPRSQSTLSLISFICAPSEYEITYTPGADYVIAVQEKGGKRKWLKNELKKGLETAKKFLGRK